MSAHDVAWLSKFHTRAELVRLLGWERVRAWFGYDELLQYNRTAFQPNGLPVEIAHKPGDP